MRGAPTVFAKIHRGTPHPFSGCDSLGLGLISSQASATLFGEPMNAAFLLATWVCSQNPLPAVPEAVLPAAQRERAVAATARVRIGDRPAATAVAVGRDKGFLYLLTAAHVVEGADMSKLTLEFFTAGIRPESAFTLRGARAVVRRPIADLALLQVPVDPEQAVAVLPLVPPNASPKRFPFEGVSVGCSHGEPPTCERETLLGKRLTVRREDDVAFFWQAEKAQARGRSGGPLLDAEGRVVGVSTATSLGKGYYVHASEIHAALKTEGFDWLWKPTLPKPK